MFKELGEAVAWEAMYADYKAFMDDRKPGAVKKLDLSDKEVRHVFVTGILINCGSCNAAATLCAASPHSRSL